MHDMGRWRLDSLKQQQAGLNDDLKAAFETLEANEFAYGAQAGLIAGRIRALQLKLDQLAREQEIARCRVVAQGTRAKLAELAVESASLSVRRLSERKDLADVIERAIARSASST
jgi:hypothetical protein